MNKVTLRRVGNFIRQRKRRFSSVVNSHQRLVDAPVGSVSAGDWQMSRESLLNLSCNNSTVAMSLLNRLHEEKVVGNKDETLPILCLHKFLLRWSEEKQRATEAGFPLAREVWKNVERFTDGGLFERDIRTYGIIFDALASEEDATVAFRLAKDIYARSILPHIDNNFRLNSIIFASYQHLLAKSGIGDAPEEAESLLATQKRMYEKSQDDNLRPDNHVYANVIDCWVRSNDRQRAADRALELLHELIDENGSEPPNTVVYSLVCRAVANGGRAEVARALVNDMLDWRSQGYDECTPNHVTISSVVQAYCNEGRLAEGEAFCQEMQNLSNQLGDDRLEPDVSSYTILMEAWGRQDHPQRSLALFHAMLADDSKVQPDSVAFNSLLLAWARSTQSNRIEMVVDLFEKFRTEPTHRPLSNTISLNILLNYWNKHNPTKASALQAEKLVSELEKGDILTQRPDSVSYVSLISLLGQAGEKDAARGCLERLMNQSLPNQTEITRKHFHAYLSGLMKSGALTFRVADGILDEMNSLSQTMKGVKPNVITYNILLSYSLKSNDPDAPWMAEDLFRRLIEASSTDSELLPDNYTYATMCSYWARSSDPEALSRIDDVLSTMQKLLPAWF